MFRARDASIALETRACALFGSDIRLSTFSISISPKPAIFAFLSLYSGLLERTGSRPWGNAVSRIWRALKEAERLKSRSGIGSSVSSASQIRTQTRESSDRRTSPRALQNVLLLVYGSDDNKQPFHEESETLDVSDNGCSLLIEAPISCGQRLFLANTVNQAELQARVIHVGRRIRGKVRIGVEFLHSAPEFWFNE